jgi:PIN domain nuclease of toxin-antitoxin system
MPVVLDASAVLALLFQEEGQDIVGAALRDGAEISTVNVAETISRLVATGMATDGAASAVLALPMSLHDLDGVLAMDVGTITAQTHRFGLSLGDRACLALAKRLALPALTADRVWLEAGPLLGVEVRLIR